MGHTALNAPAHPRAVGFWAQAHTTPGRPAVVAPDGATTTFGELLARSNQLAHAFADGGLERGDAVAVMLTNALPFLEVFFAALQSGLYFTPVNFHLTPAEAAYVLRDSDARLFVGDERVGSEAVEAARLAGLGGDATFLTGAGATDARSFDELGRGVGTDAPPARSAGQIMLYTSGTTGRPKGVRRPLADVSPDDLGAAMAAFQAQFAIRPGEAVHLGAGPLYHSAPLAFGTSALHLGHTLVLMDKWSPEETLALIEKHQVTYSHMVPTMFHRLLALPDEFRRAHDPSSLRSVVHAAAPCPVPVKRRMIEWWGPVLWEYYAATEIGGTAVDSREWLERPGTVGRPWPGSTVIVLDDDGEPCASGEVGTVYMANAAQGRFEYHGDPVKTAGTRRGDLVTVGDLGYLDEDGWLFISDRRSDLIISGGVNIYPAEIEAELLDHPLVQDVGVIGVPNDDWGQEVKAIVQPVDPDADTDALEAALRQHCRDRLAAFKVPRSFDFRSELPRYATGKLYKQKLRDDYWPA